MFTYRYRELAVALEKKGEVRLALAKTLRVNPEEIFNLEVERFSLDSRRKGDLHWSYNVVFDLKRKVRATGNNARGLIESKREIRSLDAEPLKDTVAMASSTPVAATCSAKPYSRTWWTSALTKALSRLQSRTSVQTCSATS